MVPVKSKWNWSRNTSSVNSQFIETNDVEYLKDNIAEYFFEKGDMVVNGHNISDIVFLKKNG